MNDSRQAAFDPEIGEALPRVRLMERLEAMPAGSLVLVVAGSGYGKSTLVEQWSTWSSHVVRIARVQEDGDSLANLVHTTLDAQGEAPFTLVIDDVHLVRCAAGMEFLRRLAHDWPAACSLVLVGRERPPVALVRSRLDSPMHLISESDLSFDERELQELLRNHGLDPMRVSEIVEWTGGWPAGVRLTLANRSFRGTPDSLSEIADGRADEFELLTKLAHIDLAADEIEFLEVLSVLTPTTTDIVDAVLNRNDTLPIVQEVLRRRTALVELTDETPAKVIVHTLLASALRRRLERNDPMRSVEIRRRAADALVDAGHLEQAVRLLEDPGDIDAVVDVFSRNMTLLFYKRPIPRLSTLVRRPSLDGVRTRPALAMAVANTVEPSGEAELHRVGPRASLTAAERRILAFLPSHYSIPRIASELHIAQSTAKTQCLAVYRKLDVNSRAEAVRTARAIGLLDLVPHATG